MIRFRERKRHIGVIPADRDMMRNIALIIGVERIISRLRVRYEVDRYQRVSILRVERLTHTAHTSPISCETRYFNAYICSRELH